MTRLVLLHNRNRMHTISIFLRYITKVHFQRNKQIQERFVTPYSASHLICRLESTDFLLPSSQELHDFYHVNGRSGTGGHEIYEDVPCILASRF